MSSNATMVYIVRHDISEPSSPSSPLQQRLSAQRNHAGI